MAEKRLFVSYITAAGSVCDLAVGSRRFTFRALPVSANSPERGCAKRIGEGSIMQTATASKAGTGTANLVWRIVLPTILACGFASTLAWICLVGYGAIVLTSLAF